MWLDLTKIEGRHLSLVDQLEQDGEAGGGESAPDGAGQQVPQQGELPGGVVRPGQPRPGSAQRQAQHQLGGGQAGRRCQQGGKLGGGASAEQQASRNLRCVQIIQATE